LRLLRLSRDRVDRQREQSALLPVCSDRLCAGRRQLDIAYAQQRADERVELLELGRREVHGPVGAVLAHPRALATQRLEGLGRPDDLDAARSQMTWEILDTTRGDVLGVFSPSEGLRR
jgi:hypothetical protein